MSLQTVGTRHAATLHKPDVATLPPTGVYRHEYHGNVKPSRRGSIVRPWQLPAPIDLASWLVKKTIHLASLNPSQMKGALGEILFYTDDVPGLNPAIRAVTIRAMREGYQVIGIRRGCPVEGLARSQK